jgi:segregation and condensation protein A
VNATESALSRTEAETEAKPYKVKLPVFEGPLDLLLHLIEQEELDITKVSLAQVTDQYLEYIGLLAELSAEILADFLVIAAKLLLIKSEFLLPRPPGASDEEEEEDLGDELARQLIEYKKFKEAALELREREETGHRAYVRLAPLPKMEKPLAMEDVSLSDLVAAVRVALNVRPPAPSVSHVVAPFTVTVREKMTLIKERLEKQRSVGRAGISFNRLLDQATSRLEIIITLQAVLELIKMNGITVQQERLFGEIFIFAKPPNQAQRQERAENIEADVG